ncbi:alpha/beta hydrolase [uncultured Brevundimonas sp.]|mgnify:CR=1 FL=1|uniref:alpha/beta fold hydrolase n=1 Tax=uncultured Brevundimonas sp. TaxID=213418 RepID=UPI0025E982E3|nr:alpha/beta hydrolase [uncultured Brevundimonas sp.]
MSKITAPARTLRAFMLAAAVGWAVGAICSPTQAAPVEAAATQAASAFASDRLSIEVMGQGPDVILIPGFASSRDVWRPQAQRLSATHRVHLVQLSGFAGEAWSHGDGAFVQPAVDEVARYARTLNRPAIIGHSMGALVGLLAVQQHPEVVGKLMSVDSLPFFSALYGPTATAESAKPFAEQAAAGILNADAAGYRAQQQATAAGMMRSEAGRAAMVEWSMASDRHAMASAIRDVMTTDARPGLAAMTTPVWAVYAADANGGVPSAMADAMWSREYAALPSAKLVRVDDSRHFIMNDQPERLAVLVDEFLAD